ncbi:GDSL-type esterase/lipase family protein [Paenibacillus aurantius]|uniref:GDSL-type esterase/lipase family protein n=1 Tax=Paenibacillus aurantius TaxID=2918900 RepID=A0AA96LAE5_9BACL|nr:GDSL-type esterase/lipase family protein [Paenibacillus aurantius]WNQ09499.1 GDSL-type esterase/lipase family protein [Paenibacillus aurantius]
MTPSYRFDFGQGSPQEGYTKIEPDTVHDPSVGYGFGETSRINARDRGGEPLRRDFCIPLDASFVVDVPDGTYHVTVLMGDELAATETTIKAGEGRLMLHKLRTQPGYFARVSFAVWVTGGRLLLSFTGRAPRVNAMEIRPSSSACTIFLAGDSTVTDQPADGYPYAGWGQMLPQFVKADAAVANYALSGRSSKSFIREGHLDAIWSRMKPWDYLLIQFGHNDQKYGEERYTEPFTTYKETLKIYLDGARERQAFPILVTPVERRFFEEDGTLRDTHGNYLTAVRELAEEEKVPLLDLAARSRELYERLGPEGSKSLFMWLAPGEFLNFPDGTEDNTHFQEQGAIQIAKLAADGLKELRIQPLNLYLK